MIGSVISLWTGFSILSMYAYGKRFFVNSQDEKEPFKPIVIINKKIVFTNNNKNDKISFIKRIRKMIKKKNSVINLTPNQSASL